MKKKLKRWVPGRRRIGQDFGRATCRFKDKKIKKRMVKGVALGRLLIRQGLLD